MTHTDIFFPHADISGAFFCMSMEKDKSYLLQRYG